MKLVGLTGTIASGKSTVAQFLSTLPSVAVIYTDEIAREIVMPGMPAWSDIVNKFGNNYLLDNGTIDRKRLGNLIFNNPTAKKILESITHPHISDALASKISSLSFNNFIVIENAILFESGQYNMMDGFIVVFAEPSVQKTRLMKRSNLTELEAEQRIASQMSTATKVAKAAEIAKPMVVIDNTFDDKQILFGKTTESWTILTKKLLS